jgi:hypothetical protein
LNPIGERACINRQNQLYCRQNGCDVLMVPGSTAMARGVAGLMMLGVRLVTRIVKRRLLSVGRRCVVERRRQRMRAEIEHKEQEQTNDHPAPCDAWAMCHKK